MVRLHEKGATAMSDNTDGARETLDHQDPAGQMGQAHRVEQSESAPTYEFSAPCPAGFERMLADELHNLGCRRIRPLTGSVSFYGDAACAMRMCLWSRLASRVTLVLKRIDARDADEFYDGVGRIAWEDHIPSWATIAVRSRGSNKVLHDQRYVAMRAKDAIADRLRDVRGERPSVDTERPDLLISCVVHGERATLGVDFAGGSLVNRGYRVAERSRDIAIANAYVREDLAAAVLCALDWPRRCARDTRALLVDPLGTSSSLAVEAACIACDRAPGIARRHWGFEGWLGFDRDAWTQLLNEADERFDRGLATGVRVVVATPDAGMRSEIEAMAKRAGVHSTLEIVDGTPSSIDLGDKPVPGAALVCVIPDEGLFSATAARPVRLAQLADLARSESLSEAPIAVLSSDVSQSELSSVLASAPEKTLQVMNGSSPALISVYPSQGRNARMAMAQPTGADAGAVKTPLAGAPTPSGATIKLPDGSSMQVMVAASDQFAARLHKVARLRAKWARREGVSCYRIYDADLPDYAVAVDLYQGASVTPGRWAVVSEYAAPKEIDQRLASQRLSDALAIVSRVLDIDPRNVFLKVRRHAKGGSQYARAGQRVHADRGAIVQEGGLAFEVNFSDYLDTGLFLDHRLVRAKIREMARDTRFLNLFAYTGTATCYAADGGAYSTTTVDLSGTYLDWAQRNMEQNGFYGREHEYVQADVISWIAEQRHTPLRWDLIFIDPPTFSNSARMRTSAFDVQRDHAELLIGASRILRRGGTILFSCNLRGFKPDVEALAKAGVEIEDVTQGTIPEDFERNARIHHCYIVRRS